YFVTIIAPDQTALLRLGSYDVDLMRQTAAVTERRSVRLSPVKDKARAGEFEAGPARSEREVSIDGLVTLEQVRQLVGNGSQVLGREAASKRARARQTMEFRDWLKVITTEG